LWTDNRPTFVKEFCPEHTLVLSPHISAVTYYSLNQQVHANVFDLKHNYMSLNRTFFGAY
jgi:hypothetical protein